jgi:ATP-binding cassette subfamily G (WHITE) protein 2
MSAYVMQDDLLHAELTVEETMFYAAQLRMPSNLNDVQRSSRIHEVLCLLGVEHTRKTIIGDTQRKGISGGERKRVCVAIEMLNRPKLMFLDEPTSGLDSSTAYLLCRSLKNLSDRGECTIVCTIHQPQPKTYFLFDNLILMKQGNIVYQGSALKVVGFLENVGHPCPPGENLADHLLNVVALARSEENSIDSYKMHVPVDLALGSDKPFFTREGARSWIREYSILTHRCFVQYFRRWHLILMTLVATVVISIFIGYGFWHGIGNDPSTIDLIRPAVFFTMVNQGVAASFTTIIHFPAERSIVLRERQAGAYQTSSYFLARTTCDFVTNLWPPILFAAIVYHSIGFDPSSEKFVLYMVFCILNTYAATSLCSAVVCACISIERSTVVLAFLFEITRLYGGFFTSPKLLHSFPHWKWVDALSYLKYAFLGSINTVLRGVPGSQSIIDSFGYYEYTIHECIGYLVVLVLGFRILAYLGLRFIKA